MKAVARIVDDYGIESLKSFEKYGAAVEYCREMRALGCISAQAFMEKFAFVDKVKRHEERLRIEAEAVKVAEKKGKKKTEEPAPAVVSDPVVIPES